MADDTDELTQEDMAAIDKMRAATPDQTKDAPDNNPDTSTPPADTKADGQGDLFKGDPDKPADIDDEDGEDEITLDANGRARDASGKYVPKSVLLRVKEQRKAERDENQKLRERVVAGEARLQQLVDILNAGPEDEAAP